MFSLQLYNKSKKWFIPRVSKGELAMSIGYSEPETGSDLASMQSSAISDDTRRKLPHTQPNRSGRQTTTRGGYRDMVYYSIKNRNAEC